MALAPVLYWGVRALSFLAVVPLALGWLARFEVNNFIIFAAQEPALMIVKSVLLKGTGGGDWAVLLVFFVAPSVTLTGIVIVGVWLRKRAPRLYAVATRGRSP